MFYQKKKNNFNNTKYSKLIYFEDEVKILNENGIKVHCYYLDNSAKNSFDKIAEGTKGKSNLLDVNDEKSIEKLTDIFSKTVLDELGGEYLTNRYDKKYNS